MEASAYDLPHLPPTFHHPFPSQHPPTKQLLQSPFTQPTNLTAQVVSPFQAILDYEERQSIPLGWVNHAISSSSPNGSWQRLERGEIPLDSTFFRLFSADLANEKLWREYHLKKHASATKDNESAGQAAEESLFNCPPPPEIDAEWLYWGMMRISRSPDPHMFPALKRLRKHADACSSRNETNDAAGQQPFLVAALSNTSIFPTDHEFSNPETPESKFTAELRGLFDVFVSSAHVRMRKPDVDIYTHTIQQLDHLDRKRGGQGVEAADIVFLDDIGSNLRTAKKVGMRTIKVQLGRADLAVRELERVMGLDLSSASAKL